MNRSILLIFALAILLISCYTRPGLVDEYNRGPVMHYPLLVVFNNLTESIADSSFSCEGIVSDSIKHEPMIGVSVWIANNNKIGANTDIDGQFKLNGFKKEDTIIIALVNYRTKRIAVSNLIDSFHPKEVAK
jgi:hypothetical protein